MATPKQLDAVLFFIKKQTRLGLQINYKYIWNLYINRTPELKIEELLFGDILYKLIKDGYVIKSVDDVYHLTVDGRNFHGYGNKAKWYNRFSKITIGEGIIYTLITALILWAVTKGYEMVMSK